MAIPASRDRLPRPVDISTLLPGATRRLNIIVDEPGLRWFGLGFRNLSRNGGDGGSMDSAVGVQRLGNGRGGNQQRAVVAGRDPRMSRIATARPAGGRGRRSMLPSWYPRTPLHDITGITRAIERRRLELGIQNPEAPQEENNQVEPEYVASTPVPTIAVKPASSLWKMKAGHVDDVSNSLTPQKLLESIEKVREAWLEDQRKVQRTPAAKKAERDQKVRVLMSMR